MGLRITTNLDSMVIQRQLATVTQAMSGTLRRLASGHRIDTAADDAAGLAMAERLRAKVGSLQQAVRNAADGQSMTNVAEAALGQVGDLLFRMRELSMQAGNGTLSTADRASLQAEMTQTASEIDRIAQTTGFNGMALLDGSRQSVELQIGAGSGAADRMTVAFGSARSSDLGVQNIDLGSADSARAALDRIDRAAEKVNTARSSLGAASNRLDSVQATLGVQIESYTAAESRIRDVDVAFETANLARQQIVQHAALALLAQANAAPLNAMRMLLG